MRAQRKSFAVTEDEAVPQKGDMVSDNMVQDTHTYDHIDSDTHMTSYDNIDIYKLQDEGL